MSDSDTYAEQFESHRPHLQAIAYRMLGSVVDAEDAVQEAWLRLGRSDAGAVANLGGWLTTVVGRICIDMLRARRVRNEDYVGTWLPEPIVEADERTEPGAEAELADSIGLALLVVLEALTPTERLAFVLHDMFGMPFGEIAPIIDRSPAAARQLASRARRRVRGAPEPDGDLRAEREVVEAFLAASRDGDFDALLAVLDPEVVFRVDTGVGHPLARPPIRGSEGVAREVLARGSRFAPLGRPAVVNGAIGMVVGRKDRPFAVVGCTIVGGRIAEMDLVLDPEKLASVSVG